MRDGYLGFRILLGFAALVVSLLILGGIVYATGLPDEGMQFLGNVLQQVPLFGT